MLKRIFTPMKENFTQISDLPKQNKGNESPSMSTPNVVTSPKASYQKRQSDLLDETRLEVVKVVVDERMPQTFAIPKKWLIATSTYFQRCFASPLPEFGTVDAPVNKEIHLPKVYHCDFHDFIHWLRENRIITTLHMYVTYAIEANARRLVAALALGVFLGSSEYQYAAMKEFLPLGKLLEWPEDFVNLTFDATKSVWPDNHPARKMIVAILAAKTAGAGKRNAIQGAKDKGIKRGDRISGVGFWEMYDRYVKDHGGECNYPERVEEFS